MYKSRIKARIHIDDTGQVYDFYTRKELNSFLDLIDLEQFKEWYGEVVYDESKEVKRNV